MREKVREQFQNNPVGGIIGIVVDGGGVQYKIHG